ncbi:MAG: hypothetical protein V2A67_08100 [Bacteroidota bacterium]
MKKITFLIVLMVVASCKMASNKSENEDSALKSSIRIDIVLSDTIMYQRLKNDAAKYVRSLTNGHFMEAIDLTDPTVYYFMRDKVYNGEKSLGEIKEIFKAGFREMHNRYLDAQIQIEVECIDFQSLYSDSTYLIYSYRTIITGSQGTKSMKDEEIDLAVSRDKGLSWTFFKYDPETFSPQMDYLLDNEKIKVMEDKIKVLIRKT